MFSKGIWNPTTGEELNCVQERANTEDPYAVAMIRRSAVVGNVPRKMSAACALFLTQRGTIQHDQLQLVLFNTRIQSLNCHKKFSPGQACMRAHVHMCMRAHVDMCMCGWYAYVMFIISVDLNLERI